MKKSTRQKIHDVTYELRHKLSEKKFVFRPDLRSESENGLYVQSVMEIINSYKKFENFKQQKGYKDILEHLTFSEGEAYLCEILNGKFNISEILDRIKENDLVGRPDMFEYSGIGKISPTTLRYTKVASDIYSLFGSNFGDEIVEIGCGYGGQALILDRLSNFKRYTLLDLPPVLVLISKYLDCHLLNSSYRTLSINQLGSNETFDLVISNYAFSELPIPLQRTYISKVISRSKRGYLTMNSGLDNSDFTHNKLSIEELKKLLPPFEIIEEKPITKDNNYVIVWGHN